MLLKQENIFIFLKTTRLPFQSESTHNFQGEGKVENVLVLKKNYNCIPKSLLSKETESILNVVAVLWKVLYNTCPVL